MQFCSQMPAALRREFLNALCFDGDRQLTVYLAEMKFRATFIPLQLFEERNLILKPLLIPARGCRDESVIRVFHKGEGGIGMHGQG